MRSDLGFDDTCKVDNHILFFVSRANRMIGQMVRNFISREVNVVFKTLHLSKNIIRSLGFQVSRRGNSAEIMVIGGLYKEKLTK